MLVFPTGTGQCRADAIVAGALVPLIAIWGLDVMQIRELREPEVRSGILIGGVIQAAEYVGACLTLALVGIGLSRTARANRARAASTPAPGSPGSLRSD